MKSGLRPSLFLSYTSFDSELTAIDIMVCIQVEFERYCHVHERLLSVSCCVFFALADLSFFFQPLVFGRTTSIRLVHFHQSWW